MSNLTLCVDANLVIRLIIDPQDEVVRQLWEQWDASGRQIAAPTLLYYEVSNALYRYQRAGMISSSTVRLALKAAFALPVRLYGTRELHRRALVLSRAFLAFGGLRRALPGAGRLARRRVLDCRPKAGSGRAGRFAVGACSGKLRQRAR